MVDALFVVSVFMVVLFLFFLLLVPCIFIYCFRTRPQALPTAATLVFAGVECCCCMDAQANTLFPCGHKCLCLGCASMVDRCPLCRQPVGRLVGRLPA